MQIVSALFIYEIELRQVPGPSTRIDLSGVQFSAPAPGPFPVTITPHMVVLVRNGETAIIAGLVRAVETTTRTGVPLLKDVPLIGMLFRNHNKVKSDRELIVFVTPRIVTDEYMSRDKLTLETPPAPAMPADLEFGGKSESGTPAATSANPF